MEPLAIKNMPLPALEAWVRDLGAPTFRARQIFRHLYVRRVASWDDCPDISRALRERLKQLTRLDALTLRDRREAPDGTVKYLFELTDGALVESVLIPDPPRATLCVSSQVGCALGCTFCLTGSLGFSRNLETAEIVDQVCRVERDPAAGGGLTNIVFMGMGEPLANYRAVVRALAILLDPNGLAFSHRRITLSTAGIVPALRRLGQESPVNLAISLHAAEDSVRSRLMPVNRMYPLAELMAACRDYPTPARKRITFEYVLIRGVNDGMDQARRLVRLLHGVRAKVNLIPCNPHPGMGYEPPAADVTAAFREVLHRAGLTATIRKSRGAGIGAACGQLVAQCAAAEAAAATA